MAGEAEALRALYRDMLLIRRFEEKAGQFYGMGLIGGYCHLSIGQEAAAVGLRAAARPGDVIAPSPRSHGHLLAWGADPGAVMAELLGRRDGQSGGRGGSLHMADPARGVFGGQALPGMQGPIGAGLAFAARHRGEGVAFVCLGEGAMDQGPVAEAMLLAARLHLPAVFVIENDLEEPDTLPPLHERGAPYGIPGRAADGMDVLAVREAAPAAAAQARAGGPVILELRTERFRGHALRHHPRRPGDPERRDPLRIHRAFLLAQGHAGETTLAAIESEASERVAAAAAFAEASPEASPGAAA